MKRYFHALPLVLVAILMYTSCIGSNEDNTEYYSDTAITSFKLASVNQYIHTTSKSGADSVYKKALTSTATFMIDQYQRKIYNTDSLPAGCDLSHVLATITCKNSGTILIKGLDTEGTLTYYSSSDSIDFSVPREIIVYAQDGSNYRSYEVTINMHQVDNTKILWEKMTVADVPADPVKTSWETRAAAAGMKQFIGYGRAEGYALAADGQLMASKDGGLTWVADILDDDMSQLPTDNIAFVSSPFAANDSTDYQLMIGTGDQDEKACIVWRKLHEFASDSQSSKWIHMTVESYNVYYLPKMDNLNLIRYQGMVLAIGNNGNIYESRDQGITWKTTTKYTLPDEIGTYNLTATTDADGYIWLVGKDTGEVWRGIKVE